jgi:hypothetical protein
MKLISINTINPRVWAGSYGIHLSFWPVAWIITSAFAVTNLVRVSKQHISPPALTTQAVLMQSDD